MYGFLKLSLIWAFIYFSLLKKTLLYKSVYFIFMLISLSLNIQNKYTYPFYVFTQIYYFFNTLLLNKNFKCHEDHLFINVKNMGYYRNKCEGCCALWREKTLVSRLSKNVMSGHMEFC